MSAPKPPHQTPPAPNWEVEVNLTASEIYIVEWAVATMKQRVPATHKDAVPELVRKINKAHEVLRML